MSTFVPKTIEVIRGQCIALGLFFDASTFYTYDSDCITVKSYSQKEHSKVSYNPTTGNFVGTDSLGGQFQFSLALFNCATKGERETILNHSRGYMKDLIHFFLWEVE